MHRQAGIYCHDMVVDEMKAKGISVDIVCESDNISAILALVEKRTRHRHVAGVNPVGTTFGRFSQDVDCRVSASVSLGHYLEKRKRLVQSGQTFSGTVLETGSSK